MDKKKKLFLLITLCLFMLTGCKKEDTPETLANNVVDLLSNGSVEDISSYFYVENGDFFDEKTFEELLVEKGLNIDNNKTNEVIEVGAQLTDDNGNPTVKVKVIIDNNKVVNLNTVKVDEKWYVYDNTFHDKDIRIIAPKGTQVFMNDKELSSDYLQKVSLNVKASHPNVSSNKSIVLNDVEVDAYVLKNPIIGTYKIKLVGDKVIEDEIYSYSKYGSKISSNYTSVASYTEGTTYFFNLTNDSNKVEEFVNDYLDNIYSNMVSTHSFDEVDKFFDKESDIYETVVNGYKNAVNNIGDSKKETLPNQYYDTFEVKNAKIHRINYYNNDNIIVSLSYKLSYKYHQVYSNEEYNNEKEQVKDVDTIIIIRKNDEGNYVIRNGYSLFLY